ncbi:hypothetical protein PFDG_01559 [Plasmodium falciparum Dd2]|uniref:USP domain-containing protein n=1 Tax=Plasmodium falciparum (isolate Dd2) TaxID=57267 RepID=A0A0L7LZH6_PLAF4|nr:hypothetical protein PFDG_01559 [Plasmodium falciparum Dd2]
MEKSSRKRTRFTKNKRRRRKIKKERRFICRISNLLNAKSCLQQFHYFLNHKRLGLKIFKYSHIILVYFIPFFKKYYFLWKFIEHEIDKDIMNLIKYIMDHLENMQVENIPLSLCNINNTSNQMLPGVSNQNMNERTYAENLHNMNNIHNNKFCPSSYRHTQNILNMNSTHNNSSVNNNFNKMNHSISEKMGKNKNDNIFSFLKSTKNNMSFDQNGRLVNSNINYMKNKNLLLCKEEQEKHTSFQSLNCNRTKNNSIQERVVYGKEINNNHNLKDINVFKYKKHEHKHGEFFNLNNMKYPLYGKNKNIMDDDNLGNNIFHPKKKNKDEFIGSFKNNSSYVINDEDDEHYISYDDMFRNYDSDDDSNISNSKNTSENFNVKDFITNLHFANLDDDNNIISKNFFSTSKKLNDQKGEQKGEQNGEQKCEQKYEQKYEHQGSSVKIQNNKIINKMKYDPFLSSSESSNYNEDKNIMYMYPNEPNYKDSKKVLSQKKKKKKSTINNFHRINSNGPHTNEEFIEKDQSTSIIGSLGQDDSFDKISHKNTHFDHHKNNPSDLTNNHMMKNVKHMKNIKQHCSNDDYSTSKYEELVNEHTIRKNTNRRNSLYAYPTQNRISDQMENQKIRKNTSLEKNVHHMNDNYDEINFTEKYFEQEYGSDQHDQRNNSMDAVNSVNHVNRMDGVNHVNRMDGVNHVNRMDGVNRVNRMNHANRVSRMNHANRVSPNNIEDIRMGGVKIKKYLMLPINKFTFENMSKRNYPHPPVGLMNLGNTCYLNSLLQALYSTVSFIVNLFLFKINETNNKVRTVPNYEIYKSQMHQENTNSELDYFLEEIKSFFKNMLTTDKSYISADRVLNMLPVELNNRNQQDVTEVFRYIFDKLGGSEKEFLRLIFSGVVIQKVQCQKCLFISKKKEIIHDLSFPVPISTNEKLSIQRFFDTFIQKEKIYGNNKYKCSRCNKKRNALKWNEIISPPCHLILILNRYNWSFSSNEKKKIKTHVKINSKIVVNNFDYKLYGAIIHGGISASSGHYYFIGKKSERQNKKKSSWYQMNDSVVTKANSKMINKISKDLSNDHTPYVLFYRCKQAPISPDLYF